MTNHPLTDEIIESIWNKVGNDIVNTEERDLDKFVQNSLMRNAYDKGAADRLEQVIEWIYANLVDDNEYYSNADLYSDGELRSYIVIDNIIDDLIQAMRPQVVDLPQANSDVCGEEGIKRALQRTFEENDELLRKLSDS